MQLFVSVLKISPNQEVFSKLFTATQETVSSETTPRRTRGLVRDGNSQHTDGGTGEGLGQSCRTTEPRTWRGEGDEMRIRVWIKWRLVTIEESPAPHWEKEKRKRDRERRKKRKQKEKKGRSRAIYLSSTHADIRTWNLQRVSLRQSNRRRLREVVNYCGIRGGRQ